MPVSIENTRLEHGEQIYDVGRLGYGVPLDQKCFDCFNAEDIRQQMQRFPEGQFVALDGDQVVGYGSTLRTAHTPDEPPLPWRQAIGDKGLSAHDPAGEWLYAVDFVVRPDHQGQGIGTRLFTASFDLARRLGLRGLFGGGVLGGYHRYRGQMSLVDYFAKIKSRELTDPTVTMEMKCGFEVLALIENYSDYPPASNAAALIVWTNPDRGKK